MPTPNARPIPSKVAGKLLQGQIDANSGQLAGNLTPADRAMLGQSYDPMFGTASNVMGNQTLYTALVKLPYGGPITNVILPIVTAGAGVTLSKVAVWDLTGKRLGVSADQGTAWQTATVKTIALTAPTISLPPGTLVRVSALAVFSTTGPTLRYSAAASIMNLGLAQPAFSTLASQADIPATLSGDTAATSGMLVGLS